jgi:hypothetical protein
MKIYRSLAQVPQLAALPPEERLRVHRICVKGYRSTVKWIKVFEYGTLPIMAMGAGVGYWLSWNLEDPYPTVCALLSLWFATAAWFFVSFHIIVNALRPYYAEYLGNPHQRFSA